MGPENKVDLDNCALFLNGEPIAWGKFELPEITVPDEVFEPPKGIDVCQCVEFTLTIEMPRRWRCRSRKRFIKLMMSEGVSRNNAEWLADFVRGWMPYGEAWRNYLFTGPAERMMRI